MGSASDGADGLIGSQLEWSYGRGSNTRATLTMQAHDVESSVFDEFNPGHIFGLAARFRPGAMYAAQCRAQPNGST